MNLFSRLANFIRQVVMRMFPQKNIETIERVETPLSQEMTESLDMWAALYADHAPWLSDTNVKSLNLASMIAGEIARQITLEMQWSITGKGTDANGEKITNPRADYLSGEFEKCVRVLRQKVEQGCAAGGMIIKPYPKDGHIFFDYTMDWSMYPVAFDGSGNLSDVIFRDTYTSGKNIFTRLERHTLVSGGVQITHRVFKSTDKNYIGTEVSLQTVPIWADLAPEAIVKTDDGGNIFGWFRVAAANHEDLDSPMGESVYAKAVNQIREADMQYSRLLWEYEASEMAIDVDPTVLKPRQVKDANGKVRMEMPKLNDRLFRGVDMGKDDNYNVFAPTIRDVSLINGLNAILQRIEDLCGIARGTLSDANTEARTATELRIVRNRTYVTIADNQAALEACLRDVIKTMDVYATLYNLAPEGDYEVSFTWDDSILTDTAQQLQERLLLLNAKTISKVEMRQWYLGETEAQAKEALAKITEENMSEMAAAMALESANMPPEAGE